MNKQDELKWAEDFINFGIKYGSWAPEDFDNMTEAETIDFAKRMEVEAQAEYKRQKEEGEI